ARVAEPPPPGAPPAHIQRTSRAPHRTAASPSPGPLRVGHHGRPGVNHGNTETYPVLRNERAAAQAVYFALRGESAVTTQTRRTNPYRGTMSVENARQKLERVARRLGLSGVEVSFGRTAGAARVHFACGAARVERECATQATREANLVCL